MDVLPPTTKNPIPINTHVPTDLLVSDLAGLVVLFPACARAAKLAFLRLISAAVGYNVSIVNSLKFTYHFDSSSLDSLDIFLQLFELFRRIG
jgi:hypothetical protein